MRPIPQGVPADEPCAQGVSGHALPAHAARGPGAGERGVAPRDGDGVFAQEPLLSPAEALAAAERCLQCFDAPCQAHCPAAIPIARFIRMIQSGNLRAAAEAVRGANPLAGSCGRACPEEQYCAGACTRARLDGAVAIRRLHRYATALDRRPRPVRAVGAAGGCVAIVGAGAAGLACACELKRHGVNVTLYEQRSTPGGVLAHTIPLYRFPSAAIKADTLQALRAPVSPGSAAVPSDPAIVPTVTVLTDRTITDWQALADAFDAVFVAPGAVARTMDWPGRDLRGVGDAIAFLERCRRRAYRLPVGRRVAVVGGGNVAIDTALAVARCGLEGVAGERPEVHLIYRRSRRQMPAWDREIHEAERAGVHLHVLTQPVEALGRGGRVQALRLRRTRLGPPDAGGRPVAEVLPDSDFELPCDQVLLATGMELGATVSALPRTRAGWLRVRPASGRMRGNLYAGGDAIGADQSIVAAVRDGKRAARAILRRMGR